MTPREVADALNRLLLDLDDMEQTTPEYADQQHALINYLDLHMATILAALRALDAPSEEAVERAALRIADTVMCPWGKPDPLGCGREDSPCYCERAARAALAAARGGEGT